MGLLDQVKGFGVGAWDGVKGAYEGVKDVVTDPIGAAKGIGYAVTHPRDTWDVLKKPYVDAWESGEYGKAIGMGTVEVASAIVGTKGGDKALKAAKAAKVARAAKAAADVATVAEKGAEIAKVVDAGADVARVAEKSAAKSVEKRVVQGAEKTAATTTKSADAMKATDEALAHKPGAARLRHAAEYRPNWPVGDLDDAVKRLGPVDVTSTASGKVIYQAQDMALRVVHDPHSKYFRIEDPTRQGRRRYLGLDGEPIANNITDLLTGKQHGMSASEYAARTHFRIE